jgi:hypothetical protein
MAITPLAITGLSFDTAFHVAKTTPGLRGTSRNEVYQCLDMLQIWQEFFKATFGELTGINHRSQPDDPPDLELLFGDRIVGMEHTKLLPSHVGEAEAWLRKSAQGGGLPSISSPPANKDELRGIVAGIKPAWSNPVDDWNTIFDLLAITLHKKMGGMPSGGIIGVVCELFVFDHSEQVLAQIAHDIVNRDEFSGFAKYMLIVLNRSAQSKFYSALIRRGMEISEQRGNPPPLSDDDRKFLAEIESIEAEGDDESI